MRLLIVDSDRESHRLYARCLGEASAKLAGFRSLHCLKGEDAIAETSRALIDGDPFRIIMLDPSVDGRDGVELAARLRSIDPDMYLMIVSGDTKVSPERIAAVAGPVDKVLFFAKPFATAEIQIAAKALGKRWEADRELAMVRAQLRVQVLQLREQKLELAANESRAVHLAFHDSLTGAPNRLAFLNALAARAVRPGSFATVMVDLDRFKVVNDTLGHLAGDELIRALCRILVSMAPPDTLVARLGGDEFGLLFDVNDETDAVAICNAMVAACSDSITVFGHLVQGGASAGLVVHHGEPLDDPIDLLRRADLALNDAKRSGRGVARPFDAGMDEGVRVRARIEQALGEAIARGELSLAFQPIWGRDQLEVEGFEALIRWNSDEHGTISPTTFIPIAEESNLIHDVGAWVLDRALAVLKRWPHQYASVNFSPRQFRRHDFVEQVVRAVSDAGVSPSRIQIEITETAVFDDAERAAETLDRLRRLGFRIALDDFGTGYSSLYNIRKFALDCLKIDRSFVEGMGRERESAAIVQAIVHLGRALGLGVVAEGVETEAQAQSLRLAGVSHLQGFLFGKPLDEAASVALANVGRRANGTRGSAVA